MEINKTNMIPDEKLENVAGGAGSKAIAVTSDYSCDRYVCKGCHYISLGKQHDKYCRVEEEHRDTCYGCRYFQRASSDEDQYGTFPGYCTVNGL